MSDNWQDSPIMKAAAFEGMAENPAFPIEERLGLALQAIRHLREHIDALESAGGTDTRQRRAEP